MPAAPIAEGLTLHGRHSSGWTAGCTATGGRVYAAQPNRRCQPGGMPRHSRLAYICGALITLQPSPTSTLIAQGGSSASKPAATGPTQELGGAGLCFTASASRQCSARPCTMAQLSSKLGSASLRPAAPARARPARQRAALCFSNADGKCQCGSGGRRSSGAALPVVQGAPLRFCPRGRSALLPLPPAFCAAGSVSVNFHLPYRCKYGQKLCLIGSNDMLGSWHVDRAVAMNWTEVRSGPWPACLLLVVALTSCIKQLCMLAWIEGVACKLPAQLLQPVRSTMCRATFGLWSCRCPPSKRCWATRFVLLARVFAAYTETECSLPTSSPSCAYACCADAPPAAALLPAVARSWSTSTWCAASATRPQCGGRRATTAT